MVKTGKLGRLGAAVAAAALASTMMAGVAFAEVPGIEGDTSIATTDSATEKAQGQTGIYLQVVDNTVISVNVPTKIYLAADQGTDKQDFKTPTNAKIENLGKAVQVTAWDVAATNGMSYDKFQAAFVEGSSSGEYSKTPANDSFWLQVAVDQVNYEDIAVSADQTANESNGVVKISSPEAWKMAEGGSTKGTTTLNFKLKGQIYHPTQGKYVDTPLIDTVTWKVQAQKTA